MALGDVGLDVKYRCVDESAGRPQIGIFPMIESPTGSATRGLGNGQAWYRLPVWAQKSWGPWTVEGGGGYVINRAPGMRNYFFAGWPLQRDINPSLTLGGRIFSRAADSDAGRGATPMNFRAYWNITPDFSLLVSAGRSIGGMVHRIAYFGLYGAWGPPGSA